MTKLVLVALLCSVPWLALAQGANLARKAKASASETYQEFTPAKSIDGDEGSRWSGIPGHNADVWFELDWLQPVTVGEVLVRQFDRFVMEFDIQTWDGSKWVDQGHYGRTGERITKNVLCRIPATRTTKLRIANITNGPSFTEVEVYSNPQDHPTAVEAASDLNGSIIGIVTDSIGASPVPGLPVSVSGTARHGAWQAEAKTDRHGLFSVSMPVGMTGEVSIRAKGTPARIYRAADFQFGLTPQSDDLQRTPLNGKWRFMLEPPDGFEKPDFDDSKWPTVKVPAHWEMEGFRSISGIAGYRRSFVPPGGGGRLKLRFDGVYSGAEVYVNGTLVATHEGGFTPFEADITEFAKPTGNLLALRVREHTNVSDNLDKMSLYADFPLGGIIRKVTLYRVPDVHVAALEQRTTRGPGGSAVVTGSATIVNESGRDLTDGTVSLGIGGMGFLRRKFTVKGWSLTRIPFEATVPNASFWNAEQPNLTRLRIDIENQDRRVQRFAQSIGLRETRIEGSQILINGSPVKLRGTCHHDTHPTMGRAVTPELTKQDLTLIKEANLNAVRTSHYPPLPELVEYADRIGLYVEDEADFCWVGVSNDLRNTPRIIQLTAELLARDRNHPSVFMWSLCNESEFGYGFERSHEWVLKNDPSRPTSAATSANLEIATLHNPLAISRIRENENLDRPLLFDESLCIYQGIFNDVAEMWVDPGIRDYYVEPQIDIYKAFMASKTTQGSMIWCWADDIFCVPGRGLEYGRNGTRSHFIESQYRMPDRGLVGDAPWGVVDGWRRPKPEFWITKKLHSPVKMVEQTLKASKRYALPVENQYDFTNLGALRITYRYGQETGPVRTDVAPRAKGTIEIEPKTTIGPPFELRLTFADRDGRVIDEYAFPIDADIVSDGPEELGFQPPALQVFDESLLAGDSTHVLGGSFELAFDKDTGFLRRCVAIGQALLLDLPSLHVLPTDRPLSPLPDRLAWRMKAMQVRREGERVRVSIQGSYPQFEGGYELSITPAGHVTVDSKFTYSGPDLNVRETGMRLSLPRECQALSWDRKAEWNVYPADHIGRPVGSALAFPASQALGDGSWSLDPSPMGSNDFRSTKRHIRWGWLGYPHGSGIAVLSDGSQSVRAMVDTDHTALYVNDWYGGTNVGWWEWRLNYGVGKAIRTGDTLASRLELRLGAPDRAERP